MSAAVVVLTIVIVLLLLSTYNGLIHLRQEIRLAWAQMDELLKQRYELVLALVPLGQSSGGDVAAKMPPIVTARNQAALASDLVQLAVAESALTAALHQALAAIESHQTLKEDLRIAAICDKVISNQKLIEKACRRYNEKVHALNSSMSSFPQIITAKTIGLRLQPIFDLRV